MYCVNKKSSFALISSICLILAFMTIFVVNCVNIVNGGFVTIKGIFNIFLEGLLYLFLVITILVLSKEKLWIGAITFGVLAFVQIIRCFIVFISYIRMIKMTSTYDPIIWVIMLVQLLFLGSIVLQYVVLAFATIFPAQFIKPAKIILYVLLGLQVIYVCISVMNIFFQHNTIPVYYLWSSFVGSLLPVILTSVGLVLFTHAIQYQEIN